MICKNCSATLPDDSVFCNMCGTRVEQKKVCPMCNQQVAENSLFCSYCGAKITNETTNNEDSSSNAKNEEEFVPTPIPVAEPASKAVQNATENDASDDAELEDDSFEDDEDCDVEAIVCTQCGSGNVELISEELGKCKNCGTQVIIKTPQQTNVINTSVNIQMMERFGKAPLRFCELRKEFDATAFFVKALTEMAYDKDVPDDIFINSKFAPVKTEYRQYALAKGTAQMSYSATIGYDRKVEYKEYNSSNNSYVTKTKIVTDWKPFSGSHTGEYVAVVPNDNNQDYLDCYDYKTNCLSSTIEYDKSVSKAPAPLAPTSSTIESLESRVLRLAEFDCKNKLPGDKNKDFNCSGTATLTLIESHVAPQYILNFTYGLKNYHLKAHSAKKSRIRGEKPTAKKEIDAEIEQVGVVKTFNVLTFFALIFSIISALSFATPLKITFTIIAVVLFIISCIVKAQVAKEVHAKKLAKKKSDLIALLKKKGLQIPKELKEGGRL